MLSTLGQMDDDGSIGRGGGVGAFSREIKVSVAPSESVWPSALHRPVRSLIFQRGGDARLREGVEVAK